MARKEVPARAPGPWADGSIETPWLFEKRAGSLKASRTSAWRERAQKAPCGSR